MRALGAALAVAAAVTVSGAEASGAKLISWDELDGWAADDHGAALAFCLNTCGDMDGADWAGLCALARSGPDPRGFFEMFFRPILIEDDEPALFTGYFEPELEGSRSRTPRFTVPLYRRPPEVAGSGPWLTRGEIEQSGVLRGRGLEIAWIEDPVDKFFLQIQGSGRIRLVDGGHIRVGYGGKNGHPYRSVGREMIRRGLMEAHQASAQAIRSWVRRQGPIGTQMLHHNPSYVFFREVTRVPADQGPLGAMNRSITAGRSIAVDPEHVPLGAPVWLEKDGRDPIRRLMVAQDTGSAIKGAQRADVFYGTGEAAGDAAGRVRDPGRMVVLLPIEEALALAPEE